MNILNLYYLFICVFTEKFINKSHIYRESTACNVILMIAYISYIWYWKITMILRLIYVNEKTLLCHLMGVIWSPSYQIVPVFFTLFLQCTYPNLLNSYYDVLLITQCQKCVFLSLFKLQVYTYALFRFAARIITADRWGLIKDLQNP